MKRVQTNLVKERTREASNLFASYKTLGHLLHTVHDCLVTEIAHDKVSLVAHTHGYVQVLLPHQPSWMGCKVRVRIIETAKFYVRGEVLEVLMEAPDKAVAAEVVNAKAGKPKKVEDVAADLKKIVVVPGSAAAEESSCCEDGGGCGGGCDCEGS